MATNLIISNKLLSLKGRMHITDQSDQIMFEARGEFAFLSPTWRIHKGTEEVATVRRKILSFAPTWDIDGNLGKFAIKRHLFSFGRKYTVLGGPFDGVVLTGNIWDLTFNISNGPETIAKATGNLLSLRDRRNIEVIKSGEDAELMTVIAMVTLQLEKRSKRGVSAVSNNNA